MKDLLYKMLDNNPKNRITLDQINEHPAFKMYEESFYKVEKNN